MMVARAGWRRHRQRPRLQDQRFTVLIEGASGPEPHPSFIGFSCGAPVGDPHWEMAGAGQDGVEVTT
jgi:hypothetical protein